MNRNPKRQKDGTMIKGNPIRTSKWSKLQRTLGKNIAHKCTLARHALFFIIIKDRQALHYIQAKALSFKFFLGTSIITVCGQN